MSVSLYYGAERATPLTDEERRAVAALAEVHNSGMPADTEGIHLYAEPSDGEVLSGSSQLPLNPRQTNRYLLKLFAGLTEIRRAVPDATWRVTLDDVVVAWDDEHGFGLPGLRRGPRWWPFGRR